MTGQNEILTLLKRLKATFPDKNSKPEKRYHKERPQSQVKVLASEGPFRTPHASPLN